VSLFIVMLSVNMLGDIKLSIVMLGVAVLSVVMLDVVAPKYEKKLLPREQKLDRGFNFRRARSCIICAVSLISKTG
jgi:hypothetical protein